YPFERHRLDAFGPAVEIVERQAVEADQREMVEDLRVRIDAQRETADEIRLRRRELLLGGAFLEEPAERVPHNAERDVGLLLRGLQADRERARLQLRREIRIDAVGEPALLAHLFVQPRDEAAAAEHV